MNLSDSKKKLALAGVLCGLVAACLAYFGNPANMAFCIACFIRDTAGALGFHQAEVVQYGKTGDHRSCDRSIYYFSGNKRIPFNSRIFTDDPLYPWYGNYDRFPDFPWLPAPYGAPYVSR